MGVARIFQRGGHTNSYRGYSSDCHLNIVSCLLTRRLTKGGSRAPQDPPWLRLWSLIQTKDEPRSRQFISILTSCNLINCMCDQSVDVTWVVTVSSAERTIIHRRWKRTGTAYDSLLQRYSLTFSDKHWQTSFIVIKLILCSKMCFDDQ